MLKKITENPKITDVILIELETPNANGCLIADPYRLDNVTIYYIERDFLGNNYGEYEKSVIPNSLSEKINDLEKEICLNLTQDNSENLKKLEKLKSEATNLQKTSIMFYKDRTAVKVIGTQSFPAWLSTDVTNSPFVKKSDSVFTYEWNPKGSVREGDYFICWTWSPSSDGEKLSSHIHFLIEGDGKAVSSLPSHTTKEGKYEILLEKYLPEMYKYKISDNDLTPKTTYLFNESVAKGFTFIEDMANQIIDLFDANALHESLLSYLSNLFSIKLRSSEPALWRRQIKEAVPLFKSKGTLPGLQMAFSQSGMKLHKFTQYWQLHSPFTCTESFKVIDSGIFNLLKSPLNLQSTGNFKLWLKREGGIYEEISTNNINFQEFELTSQINWIGDQSSFSPLNLFEGDFLKIKYQYKEIDGSYDQSIEDYIETLPLSDQRNENSQKYPLKNWNIKLISEEDPLFSILIPIKHPFQNLLMFGFKRTEFAYSENIYNADEYNGSIRPSFDPCFIEKEFIDPCGSCISSTYTVDLGIEDLCNDRIFEAKEILKEYTPFHAMNHSINFNGELNDFVQCPVEKINCLINFDHSQFVLSGNSNPFFHRHLELKNDLIINRQELTDQLTVLSGKSGNAYNSSIYFMSPDHKLSDLGVISFNHILEISAPSSNFGNYTINKISGHIANVASSNVIEPINESAFTFKLSNILYENSISSILQDDHIEIEGFSLNNLNVKTIWDVINSPSISGNVWSVLIPSLSANPYEIESIENDIIVIKKGLNPSVSNINNVSIDLLDGDGNIVSSNLNAIVKVERRGKVDLNAEYLGDLNALIKIKDYLVYENIEYEIIEMTIDGFYIKNYNLGDAVSINILIKRRLVENGNGYFGYKGLNLTTFADHESEFEIVNGSNPPPLEDVIDNNRFKESYMFKIGNDFYKILQIDRKEVVLDGRNQNWMTKNAGGTTLAYSIVHFPKNQVNIGFTVFDQLGRDGKDPVVTEIYSEIDQNTAIVALSSSSNSSIQANINQEENVSFQIETKNGKSYKGII